MPKAKYDFDLPKHEVKYGVPVLTGELKIDPEAQRTLNEKRARSIANKMVSEALGSVIISQRSNGDLYIVDGQHRVRACQLAGIETMMAEIHYGLTQAQEAILFLIKNRESHKPRPIDEYHVGLTGGVPLFVDTNAVLDKHGLTLGSTSTNGVGAVSGALQIVDRFGAEIFDRTLTVAETAWGRSQDTWDGMLLGGIGMCLGRWGGVIDDKELAKKMLAMGTAMKWRSEILSQSSRGGFNNSGTGSRVTTAYRLVVVAWNKGRKAENRIDA
ncbi:ParB N-terminal domain-containing protein [Streptomyces sp. NBC_01463]